MNYERKSSLTPQETQPHDGSPQPYSPPGGIEVFVDSMLSEPSDMGVGLDDEPFSDASIEAARACRLIDDSVDPRSPKSVERGLRLAGEVLGRLITYIHPNDAFDTTGLIKVEPHKQTDASSS